jgi:hypothetical protein
MGRLLGVYRVMMRRKCSWRITKKDEWEKVMYSTPYQDGVVFSFHDMSIITVLCLVVEGGKTAEMLRNGQESCLVRWCVETVLYEKNRHTSTVIHTAPEQQQHY